MSLSDFANEKRETKFKENPYDPKGKIGTCSHCNKKKPLYYWHADYKFCSRDCESRWMDFMSRLI